MPATTRAGSSKASTSTSTSTSASATATATASTSARASASATASTSASGSGGASGSGSGNARRRRSGRKGDGSDLIASGAEFYHKMMQEHHELRQLRSEPISELEYLEKKVNKLREMIAQVETEKNRLIEEAKKEKTVLVTLSPEAYFQEN